MSDLWQLIWAVAGLISSIVGLLIAALQAGFLLSLLLPSPRLFNWYLRLVCGFRSWLWGRREVRR